MNVSSSPALFPSVRKSSIIFPSYEKSALLARDVRNPLTCIDLSIDMLKLSVTDEERNGYMEIITRSSKRINQIIKDLLECQEVG